MDYVFCLITYHTQFWLYLTCGLIQKFGIRCYKPEGVDPWVTHHSHINSTTLQYSSIGQLYVAIKFTLIITMHFEDCFGYRIQSRGNILSQFWITDILAGEYSVIVSVGFTRGANILSLFWLQDLLAGGLFCHSFSSIYLRGEYSVIVSAVEDGAFFKDFRRRSSLSQVIKYNVCLQNILEYTGISNI